MNARMYKLYQVLIIPFIIIISIAILVTGFFTWHYSETFAKDFGRQINQKTVNTIEKELNQYLKQAHLANQDFKRVINHELIDIKDTESTFRYMQDILLSSSDEEIIATLQIAYPNGDYLGVSNSSDGIIKKVANANNDNAFQSILIKDNSVLVNKPNYDARSRPWFIDAKQKKKPVWSNVYTLFSTEQLATTLSEPIYHNGELIAVIGSDIILSNLSEHLRDITPTQHAYLFILDNKEKLIAHSLQEEQAPKELLGVNQINYKLLKDAYSFIQSQDNTQPVFDTATLKTENGSQEYLISYTPFQMAGHTNWHMGIVIPQSDFFGHANQVKAKTLWIWLFAFIIALITGLLITTFINRTIKKLHNNVLMTQDTGSMFLHSSYKIKEINELSIVFSKLSRQFYETFLELKNSHQKLEDIVEKRTEALTEANKELITLTKIDPLTQINNRRGIHVILDEYILNFNKGAISSVSCFMIDVDYFKNYNDTYGHSAGDDCLINISAALKDMVQDIGEIGRVGGEEFVILIPNISIQKAEYYAQNMLSTVSELKIPHSESHILHTVSISIGVYHHDNTSNQQDITAIIDYADKALYKAKTSGKNKYELFKQ